MTPVENVEKQVLAAASDLVHAFGRHDRDAYFGSFTPDATFVFYTVPEPLNSRVAYERLWASWERDAGFQVSSCTSLDGRVRVHGESAVFTHRVLTVVQADGERQWLDERETIVFARQTDGRWLAVHEHLSPSPADPGEATLG
ncbi:YybH family protein [Nocardioides mesophilus]|uniref:Nuclear transport factor 2 family protein n=1 Tax=Nocardioides mesophilus TaxID=433659 RepID=A0A7G9RER3_9ACTN|nr:nuclear transport factor 2 family protein [Nocardioides mesophilus]QNN54088.1 nuclear transport factor 2 family protein [Nocardioides mesophilus]